MNSLKEIDIKADTIIKCFDNVISKDRKTLHLSYLSIAWEKGYSYNEFFDLLDQQTNSYDCVEILFIETDSLNDIPEHVLKFKQLKQIMAYGCRFWDLNMLNVPCSVKIVDFTRQSNLQSSCIKGVERLTNLERLNLDMDPFMLESFFIEDWALDGCGFVSEDVPLPEPFPDIEGSKLHTIVFEYGRTVDSQYIRADWKENILNNPFFKEIRHRVTSIHHSMEIDYPTIYESVNMNKSTLFDIQIKLRGVLL